MPADEESAPPDQKWKRRANKVELKYVNQFEDGYRRRRCGTGFTYLSRRGRTISSQRIRKRIASLVIPPAWQDVWVCPDPNGHIQAMGRDEAGRRQYVYHERWTAVSTAAKYDRMPLFAELLPRIRRRLRRDLKGRTLTRRRVLAAVVRVLDRGHVRVGNERSVKETGARGATTLAGRHVELNGFMISLDFPGKSGQQQHVEFADKKVARVIQLCEEIDGQYLFSFEDQQGAVRSIDSTAVNAYLRETAAESVSAREFRTWWGSVTALKILSQAGDHDDLNASERKRLVRDAVAETAGALGNTTAVCRKSYIHPGLLKAAESGELPSLLTKINSTSTAKPNELTMAEQQLAALLPHLDLST